MPSVKRWLLTMWTVLKHMPTSKKWFEVLHRKLYCRYCFIILNAVLHSNILDIAKFSYI